MMKSFVPSISLNSKFVDFLRKSFGVYSIISIDPPIFYVHPDLSQISKFATFYKVLFDYLQDRNAYFLFGLSWSMEKPGNVNTIKKVEHDLLELYPKLKFLYLCNTPKEMELFQENKLQAILCNKNCLLDEKIFQPLPDCKKRFDAVYDARLVEWKRHYLASSINSLAFIYYIDSDKSDAYVNQIKRDFSYAHFFNHAESGEYLFLRAAKINEYLNACQVGLCLSEVEGNMFASGQYLLNGLPIVSTKSLGGRDLFFDEKYVSIVENNPDAVKEAVDDLIRRNISPSLIRQNTIEKFQIHRQSFISLVQHIYEQENVKRNFQAEWSQVFYDKLYKSQDHYKTIKIFDEYTD